MFITRFQSELCEPMTCSKFRCMNASVLVYSLHSYLLNVFYHRRFHLPPKINVPDVQLELSATQPLRTVVDRLKTISPTGECATAITSCLRSIYLTLILVSFILVYMEGSMAGEMTLRIDSDGASIRTFFSKLTPRFEDCKSSQPDTCCTIKVDTKKLSTCLQWQATMSKHVSSAMLCMVENEMLVLHVCLNPSEVGFFTYYIPVHFLSNDPADE